MAMDMKKPIQEMNKQELKTTIKFCNEQIVNNHSIELSALSMGVIYERIIEFAEKKLEQLQ